jgi:DNA primase
MKNIQILLKVIEDDGIDMRDAGAHFVGNCPFHEEKNASFVVYKNTERYVCFGCGEKGDAIDYIMKSKGMSYNQAVKYLDIEFETTKVIKMRPSVLEEVQMEEQRGVKVFIKYGKQFCDSLLAKELVRRANESTEDVDD